MCSKPLCNLFRIFFLATVVFIHSDRAFYDPLRAQSAIVPQNSPFLLHFSVFAQFFVSHAPVRGGAWRLGGALWEGWQVCGARFPFFRGAMGTPRPCKRFAVFAAAGVCLVDCTPANGTPFPPYTGVRVCCTYAIRFFVLPAPPLIPGSPLLISICASSQLSIYPV